MFKNRLKERIRSGRPALGSWIAFSDPYAVEVMATAGYDWLVIDTEHCPIGIESLRNILIAMKGTPAVPVVRLMNNHPDHFKMALDLGAGGVIVPMVETAADARRAVESCRYPPLGKRGCGPVRASNYFNNYDEYMQQANNETLLVVQIETMQTLEELEAILQVQGVDAIFVGTGDLSLSMNFLEERQRPEIDEVVRQIFEKSQKAGIPYGTITGTPEEYQKYAGLGATLLTVGGDLGFLMAGALECVKRTRNLVALEASKSKEKGGK